MLLVEDLTRLILQHNIYYTRNDYNAEDRMDQISVFGLDNGNKEGLHAGRKMLGGQG